VDPTYVFVYLPKTGISPLISHMAEHLVWNEGIVYLGPWGDRQREKQRYPHISVWSPGKRAQIKVVTGSDLDMKSHELTGNDTGRYIAVVRDPADRWVAEYNALQETGAEVPPFWDWYDDRRVNQTTRFFRDFFDAEDADEITQRLNEFWFLTTTEHLAEDAPHLLRAIGVPDDWTPSIEETDIDDAEVSETGQVTMPDEWTGRRLEVTDEIRERIYTEHPKDRRLHGRALKRRASKRRRYGWD
jgi:hypothetical protein